MGWKLRGQTPQVPKMLIIAYPHTSNWDIMYYLLLVAAFGLKSSFMAKRSLFRPPFGFIIRALGGLSIDRSKDNNVVDATIRAFGENPQLVLGLLPEGTRSKKDHWRSGFYHIARGANISVVMIYMDFSKKEGGISEPFTLTGNVKTDMDHIRAFYAGKRGFDPSKATEIILSSELEGEEA
jgi:1-acyl-sn-glycerol-3-phosphate acyltransferase